MSIYLVRVGQGSKYIEDARREGFIAVGWNDVPSLTDLNTLKLIKQSVEKSCPKCTTAQIAAQAGQLFRFGIEMQQGDLILAPLGEGEYLVGRAGSYWYEENPVGNCQYKHRRKVEWQKKTLSKEDMSSNLSYALGATLTVYSLDKYTEEIENLLTGKLATPADKPQRIRDVIVTSLLELDGREFEEFIRHLLEILGFQAETTQYVSDKGIDVNGVLNAEGLAEITLRVQVKRVRSSIGNKEVLAIRGTLSQGEHPCLVSLSTFTSQAYEEAEATGKVPVKLIDGEDLATLILKHFDELDEQYKQLFSIRRKRDINLEDQFEVATDANVILLGETVIKQPARDWDTLVCAAKEDGFTEAFIKQKAWWAVRLNPQTIDQIKYLAMYQVAPVSQITYYGKIQKIEPYEETGKYKLFLSGDPIKLDTPVGLGNNHFLKPQGPRYTKLQDILHAKSLDDIFGKK